MNTEQKVFANMGKGVQITEEHREKRKHEGFMADLFRGKASLRDVFPWRQRSSADWAKEKQSISDLRDILLKNVDPELVDQTCELPPFIFKKLADLGFFALKVPEKKGGHELSQAAYSNLIKFSNSYCPALTILISADNTIGVKYALLNWGTDAQIAQYLPLLMKKPSGFSFTEEKVGSDPARMETYALRVKDIRGNLTGYLLNGEKWYTTNSALGMGQPLAEYLAVVAKIVDDPREVEQSDCFGIFIVSTTATGVRLGQRNEFCGWHGIYNANPIFEQVILSPDQRLGPEGEGFKIALKALNAGRIAIGAGCLGLGKLALFLSRWWAQKRVQLGKPIGDHEAIGSGMLAQDAATILAMEAIVNYAALLVDRGMDVRITAAVCKIFASERGWTIADNMTQIFGGRGFETYESLSRREKTGPVERTWRDFRPNRVVEGATQPLVQWVMREGVDDFIKTAGVLLEKGQSWEKLKVYCKLSLRYLKLLLPWRLPYVELPYPYLKKHLKFVEQSARKLNRALLLLGAKHRGGLAYKQLTLERCFWIAADLFAITVTLAYAQNISAKYGDLDVFDLADLFAREARLRIAEQFQKIWKNEDHQAGLVYAKIKTGHYPFLHNDIMRPFEL